MKKILLLSLILIVLCSCKKESIEKLLYDEVTYEVITVNSNTWHGIFLNENAELIVIDKGLSNWKYTFINKNGLLVAQLDAYPDNFSSNDADVLMKIYVNGRVMVSGKCSNSARLVYIFP